MLGSGKSRRKLEKNKSTVGDTMGKLTKAQRRLVRDETNHLTQSEVDGLVNAGLAEEYIARGGRYYRLTLLGQQARTLLQEKPDV